MSPSFQPFDNSTTDSMEYKSDTDEDEKGDEAEEEGKENNKCRGEVEIEPDDKQGRSEGKADKDHHAGTSKAAAEGTNEVDCGGKRKGKKTSTSHESAVETSPHRTPRTTKDEKQEGDSVQTPKSAVKG